MKAIYNAIADNIGDFSRLAEHYGALPGSIDTVEEFASYEPLPEHKEQYDDNVNTFIKAYTGAEALNFSISDTVKDLWGKVKDTISGAADTAKKAAIGSVLDTVQKQAGATAPAKKVSLPPEIDKLANDLDKQAKKLLGMPAMLFWVLVGVLGLIVAIIVIKLVTKKSK